MHHAASVFDACAAHDRVDACNRVKFQGGVNERHPRQEPDSEIHMTDRTVVSKQSGRDFNSGSKYPDTAHCSSRQCALLIKSSVPLGCWSQH